MDRPEGAAFPAARHKEADRDSVRTATDYKAPDYKVPDCKVLDCKGPDCKGLDYKEDGRKGFAVAADGG